MDKMNELEDMRQQLAAMKETLDKSQIVSRDLLNKIMRSKVSSMNRILLVEIIIMPFILIFFWGACCVMDLTPWLVWTLAVGVIADTLVDFTTIRISPKQLSSPSIELKRFLIRQKKIRRLQTWISLPLAIIWAIWLNFELFLRNSLTGFHSQLANIVFIAIMAVSLIIGIVAVLVIMRKIDHISDDMVSDIDQYGE